MGRRNLRRFRETLHRGINEQAELVQQGECADARNVWAPNGRVVSRPGYVSLWPNAFYNNDIGGLSAINFIYEDNSGPSPSYSVDTGVNFTFTLQVGDRFYYATTSDLRTYAGIYAIIVTRSTTNAYGTYEYWNGSRWMPLPCMHGAKLRNSVVPAPDDYELTGWRPIPLFSTLLEGRFVFTPPADWATTSVSTVSNKYMLRVTCQGEATSAVTLDPTNNIGYPANAATLKPPAFVGTCKFPTENRVLFVCPRRTTNGDDVGWSCIDYNGLKSAVPYQALYSDTGRRINPSAHPASLIQIPQTDTGVLLLQNEFILYQKTSWDYETPANVAADAFGVETNEYIVGDNAPYSRDFIAQHTVIPKAEHAEFLRNRIFLAEGSTVYWSAPLPYHRVWPELNYAPLLDGDPGATTALRGFGEQVVAFKQHSIYTLSFAGETSFATAQYSVSRVVAGVGCVAKESIQEVNGRIVFLAEDGIYAFSGTPEVRKVTENAKGADRLAKFTARITESARSKATSVNWRTKSCYLLSVPIDGSEENNATIVWDYKNDAFWIWDAFSVFAWVDGALFDQPGILYFVDYNSAFNLLGVGRMDHYAAITSYVTTHRIGYRSGKKIRFREVELTCSNKVRSVSSELWPNERDNNAITGTLDFTDANELDWDDTITDTVTTWVPYSRRTVRMGYRVDCDYAQIKLTHDTSGQPFELSLVDVGFMVVGDR